MSLGAIQGGSRRHTVDRLDGISGAGCRHKPARLIVHVDLAESPVNPKEIA